MRENWNDNRKEKSEGQREREREMIFYTNMCQVTKNSKIIATAKLKKAKLWALQRKIQDHSISLSTFLRKKNKFKHYYYYFFVINWTSYIFKWS